jgi:hypothetical protein
MLASYRYKNLMHCGGTVQKLLTETKKTTPDNYNAAGDQDVSFRDITLVSPIKNSY